jgi:hypothetical protein
MKRFIGQIEVKKHEFDKIYLYKFVHYYLLSWLDTFKKWLR